MKHYAVVSFSVDENDMVDICIDHRLMLETFGGVAYDESTRTWLAPSQLDERSQMHDSEFLRFLGNAIANSMPSDVDMEIWEEGHENP